MAGLDRNLRADARVDRPGIASPSSRPGTDPRRSTARPANLATPPRRLAHHFPRIASTPIDAPLFVVGPPRTGTTILLELLALDPQLQAPIAYEALYPLTAMGSTERRLRLSESEQELWADIHPEFLTMHDLREQPAVRVCALPDVRLLGSVLEHDLRHASSSRAGSSSISKRWGVSTVCIGACCKPSSNRHRVRPRGVGC